MTFLHQPDHEAPLYLAVHPAQATLLNDEVPGRLQEVGAEVPLLDVIVLIPAVSGPGPGPDGGREEFREAQCLGWNVRVTTLSTHEGWGYFLLQYPRAWFFFSFLFADGGESHPTHRQSAISCSCSCSGHLKR